MVAISDWLSAFIRLRVVVRILSNGLEHGQGMSVGILDLAQKRRLRSFYRVLPSEVVDLTRKI